MPLHLRIDNMDSLPDGGPVSFELNRRGIDVGRDPYLDWTLPDPERFVSGKHCEIRYRDGGYWLHDVSTNGTTVNGRPGRLTEPYRLQDGDRIHIGHYIIAVELRGEDAAPAPAATAKPFGSNVWDDVPEAAAAVDRRDFAARARPDRAAAGPRGPADLPEEDISWSIGEVTQGAPADDVWGSPAAGGSAPAGGDWGWTPPAVGTSADAAASASAQSEQFAAQEMAVPRRSAAPGPEAARPAADPFLSESVNSGTAGGEEPSPRRSAASPVPPSETSATAAVSGPAGPRTEGASPPTATGPTTPSGLVAATVGGGDFVAAFERGAGLPPGAVAERADDAFAEELGALFRLVAQNLQAMLAARAETKSAMRSSERTMINAFENNPLKFSPSPEDALRIMFGAKTRSYLDARASIEASFGDLQRHQVQTFAAMQQALQALIEDLDPKSIEGATAEDGGLASLVSSRRAKFWDTYVERFRAKSARHERGMIDAFMILFAEKYDRRR